MSTTTDPVHIRSWLSAGRESRVLLTAQQDQSNYSVVVLKINTYKGICSLEGRLGTASSTRRFYNVHTPNAHCSSYGSKANVSSTVQYWISLYVKSNPKISPIDYNSRTTKLLQPFD